MFWKEVLDLERQPRWIHAPFAGSASMRNASKGVGLLQSMYWKHLHAAVLQSWTAEGLLYSLPTLLSSIPQTPSLQHPVPLAKPTRPPIRLLLVTVASLHHLFLLQCGPLGNKSIMIAMMVLDFRLPLTPAGEEEAEIFSVAEHGTNTRPILADSSNC